MEQSTKNKVVIITTRKNDLEWDLYKFTKENKINYWEFIENVPSHYRWFVINSIILNDAERDGKEGCKYFDINHSGEVSNEKELIRNIDILINDLLERGYSTDDDNFPLFINDLIFKHHRTVEGDWICLYPCLSDNIRYVGTQQNFVEFLIYAWCNSVLKDKELAKEFDKILEKYNFIFLMHEKDFTNNEAYKQILLKDDDFEKLQINRSPELKTSINERNVKIVLFQHDGTHAPAIYGKFLADLKKESASSDSEKLEEWINLLDYFIDHNLFVDWKAFIKFRNELQILRAIDNKDRLQAVINEYQEKYNGDIKSIYKTYKGPTKTRDFLFLDDTTINPQITFCILKDIKENFDVILEKFDVHNIF